MAAAALKSLLSRCSVDSVKTRASGQRVVKQLLLLLFAAITELNELFLSGSSTSCCLQGWLWWKFDPCFSHRLFMATLCNAAGHYILARIQQQQPFYGPLSGTTWMSEYQKKHSPTHHPDHPIFISFFHLPRSIASSLFKLLAWQNFCTTSFHVLFALPLGLERSTSYSIHFFTQSVSSQHKPIPSQPVLL